MTATIFSQADSHILLLTGKPGVGKTTIIRQVAAHLAQKTIGGFYTEEIRVLRERQGFRLVTFDGRERVIAHVNFPKTNQVGKYGVDVCAIDGVVESALALSETVEVYLVDEIGKMECLSEQFNQAMRLLLSSDKTIVATVAMRGTGLIGECKQRTDSLLWEVTAANRNELPRQVLAWLERGDRFDQ